MALTYDLEKHMAQIITSFEKTFIEESNLDFPLKTMEVFPIVVEKNQQVKTNKKKSQQFGEVFTPLWLVDAMIKQSKLNDFKKSTLDLCAGYGQFSIRLLRFFKNKFDDFDIKQYLKNNHYFCELQISSCYKLLKIFGYSINLFIGDANKLHLLPENSKGIWVYIEQASVWVKLTKTISKIIAPKGAKSKKVSEEIFVSKTNLLISQINDRYVKMKESLSEDPALRMFFIQEMNKLTSGTSMQCNNTPDEVVEDMLSAVDSLENQSIGVLFNVEIIEHLIHKKKVKAENITYLADEGSIDEAKAAYTMYGVKYSLVKEAWLKGKSYKENKFNKKFDLIFSNPPYNDGAHLKIIKNLFDAEICEKGIFVHPANWLVDLKGDSEKINSFRAFADKHLTKIKCFNGNPIFDITLRYPCCISVFNLKLRGKEIFVDYFGEKYKAETLRSISKFKLNDWVYHVEPFLQKMQKECSTDNVLSHKIKTKIDKNLHQCVLAAVRGNQSLEAKCTFKDDFYTFLMKDSELANSLRKKMTEENSPTFEFKTTIERDNFKEFLKTDFARFCLSLYKIDQNLNRGQLSIIPWLDFTEYWDDEKLYKRFNVSSELQKIITDFLPDYYGIRKANAS